MTKKKSSKIMLLTNVTKTRLSQVLFIAGTSLTVLLGGIPTTIRACDVCIRLPGIPFESDHPCAIEVAMATRDAADRGDIDLKAPVIDLFSPSRYAPVRLNTISAQRMVKMWSQTGPARELAQLRFTMDIVFVDTEYTCHVDVRFGEVLVDVPRTAPADLRLFTSRAGFQSLFLDGFDKSERRSLVKLESDESPLRADISQLFAPSQEILQAQRVTQR